MDTGWNAPAFMSVSDSCGDGTIWQPAGKYLKENSFLGKVGNSIISGLTNLKEVRRGFYQAQQGFQNSGVFMRSVLPPAACFELFCFILAVLSDSVYFFSRGLTYLAPY